MLKLKVYGSSSKGNCFELSDKNTTIMIDCGIKEINNKTDISKLDGILVTHQHLDHCRDVKNIKNYYKGKLYANKDTLDKLPIIENQKQEVIEGESFDIGEFRIMGFSVYHDVPNTGFLIKHIKSNAKILYIIDSSSVTNISFKDLDYIIIEANHSYEWLENKENIEFKDYRTYGDCGHMAIEDTIEFLKENVNINTKKIILTHISSSFEDYKLFENKVKKEFDNIDVIAINPKLQEPLEIVLKEDLQGYDFD